MGVWPGEKLFKELYFDDEDNLLTPHPKVRVANHRTFGFEEILQAFRELAQLADASEPVLREKLRQLVPEYQPLKVDSRQAAAATLEPAPHA